MPDWFSDHLAPDKLKAYAVLFTVVSIGSVAVEKVAITAKNQSQMRRDIAEVREQVAEIRGQQKDKNEVMRAISNQAAQNSTYINAMAGK